MKPTTRLAVAVAATTVVAMNIVVAFLFGTSPVVSMTTAPISLVASCLATRQWIQLTREKRNGRHRRAEADTPDPETSRTASDYAPYRAAGRAASYRALASAGVDPVKEPAAQLERVESDMPILAHRSARLCLDGTSQHFRSVTAHGGSFGVDAEAGCAVALQWMRLGYRRIDPYKAHNAPGPSCTCGFYALPTDLAPTYEDASYVTLMVELSGTVIEHELGYRAEHQRVVECQVQPCVYCGAEADLLVVRSFLMEQATCAAHKPVDEPGFVYLNIADLAELLPVPVTRAGRRAAHR